MYDIDLSDVEAQLAKLGKYDEIADKHLVRAMSQSVHAIEAAVKPLVPVGVSGRLRNSIASEVVKESVGSIVGKVGSTLRDEVYPAVMEFGRQPGSMPPWSSGPLRRWVELVLGDVNLAFVVARSITEKGIRGREFLKRGYDSAKARVEGFFGNALEQLAQELAK